MNKKLSKICKERNKKGRNNFRKEENKNKSKERNKEI